MFRLAVTSRPGEGKYNEIEIHLSILGGFSVNKVLEKRLEFLQLEERRFSLCEVVKAVSEKLRTSEEC